MAKTTSKTKIKLKKWDSAEHLETEEDMALYLEACLEEAGDDAAFVAKALGTIARAKGMSQLARDTGMGRESLYKALSGEGNPSFATILKVTHALGLKLHAAQANTSRRPQRRRPLHHFPHTFAVFQLLTQP
jgi:probable addiction module antidote protein